MCCTLVRGFGLCERWHVIGGTCELQHVQCVGAWTACTLNGCKPSTGCIRISNEHVCLCMQHCPANVFWSPNSN